MVATSQLLFILTRVFSVSNLIPEIDCLADSYDIYSRYSQIFRYRFIKPYWKFRELYQEKQELIPINNNTVYSRTYNK
jgi:hypothetical protein